MIKIKKIVTLGLATVMVLGMTLTTSAATPRLPNNCYNSGCGYAPLTYLGNNTSICPVCNKYYKD